MKVAVLGAYGAVGRGIAVQAGILGHSVTAVGRDPRLLAGVPAERHRVMLLSDRGALTRLAAAHDIVVNGTGVEDPDMALVVTGADAAYLDTSAEGSYLDQLGTLPVRRGVAAGVGLAPGLTNLLAASAPGSGPIHIGIIGGAGERHGRAGRRWVWGTAGRTVTSGGVPERVFRVSRRFDVPGLGRRTLLRAAFGEQDQLASDLGSPVSTWLGLDPAWTTTTLRLAGAQPRVVRYLDRLAHPFATVLAGRDNWHVVVSVGDELVRWAAGRSEVDTTAQLAARFLAPLQAAAAGVHPAHRLLDLDQVTPDLVAAGIRLGP